MSKIIAIRIISVNARKKVPINFLIIYKSSFFKFLQSII